jgi:superfamily II DNA or RNA helicase
MSNKLTITVKDEVYANISGLRDQDQEFLFEKFSEYVEGYRYMPLFKLGRWNGKVPFFSKEGKVYFRLLDEILPYLEGWGYDIDLVDQRRPVDLISTRVSADWFANKPEIKNPITLRSYQVEGVNKALEAGSGIIIGGTGAGKTNMAAALCDAYNTEGKRCYVIVPSADLVEQTVKTFRDNNLDVGTYSGDSKDVAHMTVVATWQALQYNPSLLETSGQKPIERVDAIIIDECHQAKAAAIGKLLTEHGVHCASRFGFTGTLPKPKIDTRTLKGVLGEVVFSITAADLMAQGFLAELQIEPIQLISDVPEDFPDYASEKTYLSKSPKRLELVADLIISKAAIHGNTLVLVNSIKQGEQLQKLISDSVFLYGTTENDVRAEWYNLFESRDDLIVIATFGIASTGISIDRIFCLLMIDTGKSFIRSIQSVGRSLRMGRDKSKVHCYDVYSNLKWSMKHFRERAKYYKEALYNVLKPSKINV